MYFIHVCINVNACTDLLGTTGRNATGPDSYPYLIYLSYLSLSIIIMHLIYQPHHTQIAREFPPNIVIFLGNSSYPP